jgi:hypothetical protein
MGKPADDPIAAAEAWRAKRPKKHWKACWMCTIPQRATLAALRQREWTVAELIDYLVEECGYAPDVATRNRVQHHFQEKHHETRLAS